MPDLNKTQLLSKEDVQNLINEFNNTIMHKEDVINHVNSRLIDSMDGVTSLISILIAILSIGITIYSLVIGYQKTKIEKLIASSKKSITDELNIKFSMDIHKKIDELNEENINNFDKHIRQSIFQTREVSQKDEYLRNLVFYDLSKVLASDIHDLAETDLKKVFNIYSTRLLVATQLTSGDEIQIKRALKMLSLSAYSTFISLTSVQNYIKTLELRDDLDIEKELLAIKKSMTKKNSIF